MTRVEIEGAGFNTRVDGPDGAPWIVLSNSLGTNLSMWDGQIDLLTRKYRVLRYDHRGHGQTDVPLVPLTWDRLIADVVGLMDAHGIEMADYMGLSMGLMTGLGLGIHHGDRFNNLVLCDGRADSPPFFKEMWDTRMASINAGGLEAIVDATQAMWLREDWREAHPEHAASMRSMMLATKVEGYLACCRCLKTLDYLKDAAKVANRTLCITGSNDMGAPPDVVKDIAATIPNARYVEIDGSHHIANVDGREAFNAAIAEFLEIA